MCCDQVVPSRQLPVSVHMLARLILEEKAVYRSGTFAATMSRLVFFAGVFGTLVCNWVVNLHEYTNSMVNIT